MEELLPDYFNQFDLILILLICGWILTILDQVQQVLYHFSMIIMY